MLVEITFTVLVGDTLRNGVDFETLQLWGGDTRPEVVLLQNRSVGVVAWPGDLSSGVPVNVQLRAAEVPSTVVVTVPLTLEQFELLDYNERASKPDVFQELSCFLKVAFQVGK